MLSRKESGLLARGDPAAALLEMQQETTEIGQQGGLAMAYYALGRAADSDAALARMRDGPSTGAFEIAVVYAYRGQSDETMQWLERAYAQRDPNLCYLNPELPLKNLDE